MLNTFLTHQKILKRINPKADKGEKPNVVDLTKLVDGIKDIKLKHWFNGLDVTALKIRLFVDRKGRAFLPKTRETEDGRDIAFSKNDFSCCFAEPGEKELNAFVIPELGGQHDLQQVLESFNISIDPDADLQKLPKRLKRALLVATYAGTSDVDIRITPNDALPEKFIDGCLLINLKKAQQVVKDAGRREKLQAYDTIQASLAWSEGLAKGTAILIPDLETDIIVQECNIKREVKFHGEPLLAIEGFQHARTPCSDLQTMANLMAIEPMKRAAKYHLHSLAEIADDANAADAWFASEFEHHDWYRAAVRAHLKDGKKLPEHKPPLSIARDAGIERISQTPVLKEVTFKHACRTLDIRGLKARFPEGEAVAGYLIPDVSRIGKDGYLVDSPAALGRSEIRAPRCGKHYVAMNGEKMRPVVVTRNPNAWGEAQLCLVVDNDKAFRSRTAVQVSLESAVETNMLEVWGGADMDDSLCLWASIDMLQAHSISEDERFNKGVPRVDLEQYIDAAVQDASGFDLNLRGQMKLATRPLPMHLGQIVNFFMNLRLCRQYEWYKKAAACKETKDEETGIITSAVEHLKRVYDMYNTVNPIWADVFCPDWEIVAELGYDPAARVPRDMGNYIAHTMCYTDMGDVVRELNDVIVDMLTVERTTNTLHEGARICTPEGLKWLIKQAKQEPSRVRAVVLEWGWKALTARNPIDPLEESLMEQFINGKFDFELRNDRSYPVGRRKKQKEWGRLCGRVLTGNPQWDREIVAYLGVLKTGFGRHWDNEKESYAHKWGVDSLLWNPTIGEDGVVLETGVPEIWAALMQEFEATTNVQ